MLSIAVALSYVFIVVLAVVTVRTMIATTNMTQLISDLQTSDKANGRRTEQISSAVTMIQAGLLNISSGAQNLLSTLAPQFQPIVHPSDVPAIVYQTAVQKADVPPIVYQTDVHKAAVQKADVPPIVYQAAVVEPLSVNLNDMKTKPRVNPPKPRGQQEELLQLPALSKMLSSLTSKSK